ncbi:MAG: hypothetical protein QHG99_03005 [Methanomicrobiales archaeon]|nr:hypothetical protein [Methanomicrobiales archaeon]
MDDYWDTLNARVKSAEAFILGKDLRPGSFPSQHAYSDAKETKPIKSLEDNHRINDEGLLPNLTVYSPAYTTFDQLKNTIEDGRNAFNNLILMTTIAFFAGLLLLLLAGVAGLFLQKDVAAAILGIFGISVLLAMFIMNPKEKIQVALMNMIQAQAIYLDYYNQMQIWMLSSRKATTSDERRQASEALHTATTFTLRALQEYIGPTDQR